MALTFTDLVEVDLDKLGTAVSEWKKTVDRLKTSAENAHKGMQAKSDSAQWAGVNATVTREFIAKTAKEVSDLHAEANSIYRVLADGHPELVSLQKQVKDAAGKDASALGVRVNDIGDGKVVCIFPTSAATRTSARRNSSTPSGSWRTGSTGSSPTPRRSTPRSPGPCA
ncbi:hypothetical protein N7U49_34415 [Streptomyces sp. AD2-2]|nr:hypothetical protein N7U49_34415 [Streptomyces sp. AD2-2]